MNYAFPQSGYKPPVKSDDRNFDLASAQPPAPFPDTYMTDISMIPVSHQHQIPDCVENAVTFVKTYHEYTATGKVPFLSRRSLVIPTVIRDGFPFEDGTSIENALYCSHKNGIAESALVPDNHELSITDFNNPSVLDGPAIANALTNTTYSYAFVMDKSLNGLKNSIYQNKVIVVGGRIDANWWTSANGQVSWDKKDIYPIRPPAWDSASKSNHCFVLFGYDGGGFYLRNSFGDEWGDGGNNYIPNAAMGIIYEAAAIVDLTLVQIQALKDAQTAANQVANTIHSLPPAALQNPAIAAIISKALDAIALFIKSFFK